MEDWRAFYDAARGAYRAGMEDDAIRQWKLAARLLQDAPGHEEQMMMVWGKLAPALVRRGHYEEADEIFCSIIDVSRGLHGPLSPGLAKALMDLAQLRIASGRDDEIEPVVEEALGIWESTMGAQYIEVGHCLRTLSLAQKELGKYEEAEGTLQRATAIYERYYGPHHPEVARCLSQLAVVLLLLERFEDAERVFLREFEIWKVASRGKRPDIAKSLNDVAMFYLAKGRADKATQAAKRAVSLSITCLGEDNREQARGYHTMAMCAQSEGDLEKAHELFEKSLHITERTYGEDHPKSKEIMTSLLQLMQRRKREDGNRVEPPDSGRDAELQEAEES